MFNHIPLGEYEGKEYAFFIRSQPTIYRSRGASPASLLFAPRDQILYSYCFGPTNNDIYKLHGYDDADNISDMHYLYYDIKGDISELWKMLEKYTERKDGMRYIPAAIYFIRCRKINNLDNHDSIPETNT